MIIDIFSLRQSGAEDKDNFGTISEQFRVLGPQAKVKKIIQKKQSI